MHYTNSVSTKISIYAISQIYSDEKTRSERVIAELFAKYHPSLEERESIVENVHGTLKMQGRIDYILKQLSIDTKIYDDTEIAILRLATFLTFLTKSPKSAESAEKSRHVPSKPKSWKSHNSKRSKPTKTSKPEIHKQDLKNELIKELISVTRSLGVKNVKLENDLKKIINESEKVEYPDRISNRLEYISTYHSHPYWFVKWVSTWLGVDETERFCEANNHEPPLVIRANTLKISREELAKLLKEEGFDTIPTKYSPFGLVAKQKGDIYKTKSFSNGYFETQDEASQLVTMLAKPPNRGKIVDACAGSGGKTIFLSALMENKGRIIAVELYKNKIITLKKRARRAGAFNIEPMETTDADLAKIKADVVLVDTPCTGTGTFRRNPESRWRLKESDVEELRLKQKEILNTYSKNVKEGGRLVYSTCSVLRQENEDIIEDFLKDGKFKLLNVKEFLPTNCNSFIRNGYFRAYPHIHDTDGFFAAVLEKVR